MKSAVHVDKQRTTLNRNPRIHEQIRKAKGPGHELSAVAAGHGFADRFPFLFRFNLFSVAPGPPAIIASPDAGFQSYIGQSHWKRSR